ncbi:MAG: hypothetical protein HC876_13340 [Chloroflexaceae bacterium]|nr:hypothetical protein [Chloroflexaceae bacterium]
MATEVRVPVLGESIVEATISKWLKKEGESVAAGEPIVELETDKVNLEVAAEQSGVLNAIVKGEGETVAIDDVLAMIGEGNGVVAPATNRQAAAAPAPVPNPTPEVAAVPEPQPATPAPAPAEAAETAATPVALKVAAENNVDISQVKGSGPGGRVTKEDVVSYILRNAPAPSAPVAAASDPPYAPAAGWPGSTAAPRGAPPRPWPSFPACSGRSANRCAGS